ncbi:hypothetical protein A2U01_0105553, partial [Trifolium medium]|nr:hypothetical protein [Trifolium medium]
RRLDGASRRLAMLWLGFEFGRWRVAQIHMARCAPSSVLVACGA